MTHLFERAVGCNSCNCLGLAQQTGAAVYQSSSLVYVNNIYSLREGICCEIGNPPRDHCRQIVREAFCERAVREAMVSLAA